MIVKLDEIDPLAREKEAMLAEKGGHHNQRPNPYSHGCHAHNKRQPGQQVEQAMFHDAVILSTADSHIDETDSQLSILSQVSAQTGSV
jgi:hypothetical protein